MVTSVCVWWWWEGVGGGLWVRVLTALRIPLHVCCSWRSHWYAHLAVHVLQRQAELHKLEHDFVLAEKHAAAGPQPPLEVSLLQAEARAAAAAQSHGPA